MLLNKFPNDSYTRYRSPKLRRLLVSDPVLLERQTSDAAQATHYRAMETRPLRRHGFRAPRKADVGRT